MDWNINAKAKGGSVQLYFKDGSMELLDMRCETFLANLLYYFGASIAANRNRYGKLVGKQQLVLIVLSYGITLISLNVRESIGKQTRVGWFLVKEISGFHKQSQNQTFVEFSQSEISVMYSERFCFEQLKNARFIELASEKFTNRIARIVFLNNQGEFMFMDSPF